jgi:8-oxo-dGTP pyrophosphatase MutT (NUDIX family)
LRRGAIHDAAMLNSSDESVARLAATVIVARTGAKGIEVVLTRRHENMRFMGGAYVFPGGGVQPSDRDPRLRSLASAPNAWPSESNDELDWAFAVAAMRETLEESGLLLSARSLAATPLGALRDQLLAGGDFSMLLTAANIALELELLLPFMHWVTPIGEPVRFDTRFYVAAAPEGQTAASDARENVELVWLSPGIAIERAQRREMKLSPPTLRTLEQIDDVTSLEDLLARARASLAPRIEPVIREVDGVRTILFPGDPEHPVPTKILRGVTRVRF